MRHFAEELKNKNCNLEYIALDDAENTQSLKSEVVRACNKHNIQKVTLTHPGEYRVLEDLLSLSDENIDIEILEDTFYVVGSNLQSLQPAKNLYLWNHFIGRCVANIIF